MRILLGLTYYRPHISGLTVYAERLARGLVRHGHQVTVLTSRFHRRLPERETVDGVAIVRVPVARSLGKGVVMPSFPLHAWREVGRHDVVNVHMPQLEASLLAGCGRLRRRPVVVTYHCDLQLPPGLLNRVVEGALHPLNRAAAGLADRLVVTTADYGEHSPFLRRYRERLRVIPPLVDLPAPDPAIAARLLSHYRLDGRTRIGYAARFSAEKGVEYLLDALPALLERLPDACVAFTGAYRGTVGEEAYHARLQPRLDRHRDRLVFLDLLSPVELASFLSCCHVLAVTSLNSTESFGLVQVEAMLAGTPVVATDLPGVRQAVRLTGMGEIVPPADAAALADALGRVVTDRARYVQPPERIAAAFDLDTAIREYEALFAELIRRGARA